MLLTPQPASGLKLVNPTGQEACSEAVVDIARAAGVEEPSGVICEIMKDDGEMARLPDLIGFAAEHDLKIGSIADLIAYRRSSETLVQRTVETSVKTRVGGDWRLMIFENTISGIEHIALIKGDISPPEPVLVRMHRLDMMSDVIGEVSDSRTGHELESAMKTISDAGRGIVVLLRESLKTRLSETISASLSGGGASDQSQGLRDYGVGAQILNELGVSCMILLSNHQANVISLDGYELEITGWQPLDQTSAGKGN